MTRREAIDGGVCALESRCAAIEAHTGGGACRGPVAQIVAGHALSPEHPPASQGSPGG